MGGTNSDSINNLRFHVNNGEVHIHDDARSLKFVAKTKNFTSEVKEAINTLETTDGIIKIDGTSKEKLYLIKDNKNLLVFIANDVDQKDKLETFLKGC